MKVKTALLLWIFILGACSSGIAAPRSFPSPGMSLTLESPPDPQTPVSSEPKIIVTVGTPHIDPGPNGEYPATKQTSATCAFSWSNSPLEELTHLLDTAIKEMDPQASGSASAFGEDCIYQDGSKKFLAMETDYYIKLPASDLSDYETFGNWIAQTMPVVESMPADMIDGPQTGFVEYNFKKSGNEFLIVRVPIQSYKDLARGKSGEELFRMFYTE
jgi:hypothetical protein